jgi:hypothetical protein
MFAHLKNFNLEQWIEEDKFVWFCEGCGNKLYETTVRFDDPTDAVKRATDVRSLGFQCPENPLARCGIEVLSIEPEKERFSQCGRRRGRIFFQCRGPDQSLSRGVHGASHLQAFLSRTL